MNHSVRTLVMIWCFLPPFTKENIEPGCNQKLMVGQLKHSEFIKPAFWNILQASSCLHTIKTPQGNTVADQWDRLLVVPSYMDQWLSSSKTTNTDMTDYLTSCWTPLIKAVNSRIHWNKDLSKVIYINTLTLLSGLNNSSASENCTQTHECC